MLTSEELAGGFRGWGGWGRPYCVVIGGSLGLSGDVMKADFALTFLEMTFPHQLMRWCWEQVYRSYRIITGGAIISSYKASVVNESG